MGLLTGTVTPSATMKPVPPRDPVHPEGADERRHGEPRDHPPVDVARDQGEEHGRAKADEQGEERGFRAESAHDGRENDRRESHDEADGEVDSAGDDDERDPDPEQQGGGREDEDALDVERVEDERDRVDAPGPDLEEHDHQDEEQPGPDGAEQPEVHVGSRVGRGDDGPERERAGADLGRPPPVTPGLSRSRRT